MNNTLKWILVFVLGINVSFVYAQENKKDTIHIITETIIGDKTITCDTIIVMTADNEDEIHEYLVRIEDRVNVDVSKKKIQLKLTKESMHGKNLSSDSYIKIYHSGDNKVKGSENVFIYELKGDGLHESHEDIHIIKERLHRIGEKEHKMAYVVRGANKKMSKVSWVSKSGDDEAEVNVWVEADGLHDKNHNLMVHGTKGGTFNISRISDITHGKMFNYHFIEGNSLHENYDFNFDFVFEGDDGSFIVDSLGMEKIIIKEIIKSGDKKQLMFISEDGEIHIDKRKVKFDDLAFIDENVIHLSKADKNHELVFYGDKNANVERFGFSMINDLDEAELANLSDIGIKSKNAKLKMEKVFVYFGEDSELNVKFKLNTKGKARIKLYNESGLALFSDKVQYFPGTYDKTMNITSEDKGTYYLSVVQGNASDIRKLTIK